EELRARSHRMHRDRDQDGGGEAREDAHAAERRRDVLVPAIAARRRHDPRHERRAQQRPDRERGNRQRNETDDGAHRAASSDRKSSALAPTACTATAIRTAAAKPAKMPTPPSVGVTFSCQRSPLGAATTRATSGERSSAQIVSAATGNATRQTMALTAPPP